jgi:hypothetical protein
MTTTPLEIFRARCQARALLWQAGEFTLHQAVDELEAYGRALKLDVDEAQGSCLTPLPRCAPMTDWKQVAQDAWDHPDWAEAAREFNRERSPDDEKTLFLQLLLSDDVTLEQTYQIINSPEYRARYKS